MNYNELMAQIEEIKTAKKKNSNTAEKVGGAKEGIAREIEPLQKFDIFFGDISGFFGQLSNEAEILLSKDDVTAIMGESYDTIVEKLATDRPNILMFKVKVNSDDSTYNYNVISAFSSIHYQGEFYQATSMIDLFERKLQLAILGSKIASSEGYYGAITDVTE